MYVVVTLHCISWLEKGKVGAWEIAKVWEGEANAAGTLAAFRGQLLCAPDEQQLAQLLK